MVPKLAFSVKPQATLRTFIGMASASENIKSSQTYIQSFSAKRVCLFVLVKISVFGYDVSYLTDPV